jgi:acetyl-CoA hydrolase
MVDLSNVIRPGDGIVWGQVCAEARTLVEAVVEQRASFSGARIFTGISFSGILKPEHADHLRLTSYCGTGTNRALAEANVLDIYPAPYSQLGALIRRGQIKADVVLLQVAPPNSRGEYSLGLGVEFLAPALETARVVVAEVNDRVPWTYTEPLLRRQDFSLIVESSRDPVYMPTRVGAVENAIAEHVAELIPDGAVLECGIGNLPTAILGLLGNRRSLRFHSGVVPDGVADLAQRGAITGEIHGGGLMGTQRLFDWAANNPLLRLHTSDYTHGARVLSTLERFVAINSAVEVDLVGQVNGEVAKGVYVGTVGGALDFVRAANRSPGGMSVVALPAVARAESRIVGRLSGPVSIPATEAGVVVTQYGSADLRGASVRERCRRMIAIAAPEHREALERQARTLGLMR